MATKEEIEKLEKARDKAEKAYLDARKEAEKAYHEARILAERTYNEAAKAYDDALKEEVD